MHIPHLNTFFNVVLFKKWAVQMSSSHIHHEKAVNMQPGQLSVMRVESFSNENRICGSNSGSTEQNIFWYVF